MTSSTIASEMCVNPPEEPFQVALWQYIVTTLAVVLGKKFPSAKDAFRRPVSKCRSDDNYVYHVGGDAPPASVETLQRSLRVLRRTNKVRV